MSDFNQNTHPHPGADEGGDVPRTLPSRWLFGKGRRSKRAQTTLDFAIGVSLFLAVLVFVFAFVPGILAPFDLTGDHETIQTERIASQLSSTTLGSPSIPYVLEPYCTVEFFNSGSPGQCEYSGSDLNAKLDIETWRPINVSIVGDLDGDGTEILCWNTADDAFDDCPSGDRLATGEPIPEESDATVTSRRTVSLHHETVRVKVVMW